MIIRKQRILPLTEILIGSILLAREIYQFIVLPSIHTYHGPVDFIKYKENTYSLIFLWVLLLLVGILSLKNEKIKWISHQILIINFLTLTTLALVNYIYMRETIAIFFGFVLLGLIILEIILYRTDLRVRLNTTVKNIITTILLGISCTLIYLVLFSVLL
jgi:hypothetical protein